MKNCIWLFLILEVSFGKQIASSTGNIRENKDNLPHDGLLPNFDDPLENLASNYAILSEYSFGNKSDYEFEIDAGNPDINARIERPCEIYDTNCIRRFFADHSKCRISAEPVPEPLYRAQATLNTPSLNLSATLVNLEYRGIRTGKVEEFYINKATDNLVITFGFDFISFNAYPYLKFYRRGREPAVTSDYAGARFERMSITLIIPQLNDLRLDKADISTFLHVPVYSYLFNPGLVPTDPELLTTFNMFAVTLRTNQQEAFLTEGSFIATTFVQYNICDFGLKVL